uniref:Reverse transcriptase domain-containing protein n=1 Tax=Tanacetum cinerariifolium TaxID=118510 RepID=A0A699HU61_TANCI|nr:reverse transcriptase domain-containing protein [Tanacetum cinerariifolium]
MQTRSSSRLVSDQSSNPTSSTNANPKGRNRRRSKQRIVNSNLEEHSHPVVTMVDQRTMAQLLQAPTEGYEDAIVVPTITAYNLKLKHGLLTLVQNKQFYGHDKEDPHAHIRYFNKITSTLKFPNVLNTSVKLMLFPFSLEGAARIWLEKEPPRSIFTWDDLVSKFINQFFPPSKTTSLHNEITNFQQRFDGSFSEAWDRIKDLLRACPHHGFSELHQLDRFYNALNSKDQDSLNFGAGGNFLDKMPRDCLSIIESKSKVRYSRDKPVVTKVSMNASTSGVSPDVAELKDMVKALLLDKKPPMATFTVTIFKNMYLKPLQLITTKEIPVINRFIPNQNWGNNFNQGPVYQPPVFQQIAYQAPAYQALTPQTQGVSKEDFSAYVKANDAVMKNIGVSYDGPQIPPPVVENEPEATKDIVNPTNNRNTKDVQPQAVQSKSPVSTFEPAIDPVSASKPNPKASIPYPSRRNDERNREKANNQIKKFYQIFKDMSFEISFADAVILMPKFASTLKALIENKEKLSEMARTPLNEHCSVVLLKKLTEKLGDPGMFLIPCDFPGMAECLALADLGASINLMPFFVWKRLSLPDLTPTCITLEPVDRSIYRLVRVAEDVYVKVGSFHFSADFVVIDFDADPRVPLILGRSFLKTGRALIDVFKEYSQKVLCFSDTISSGSPTPYDDPIVFATSPTLTPFENSDFLLEVVDAFLAIEDEPTSSEFHQSYLDLEGDILLLEAFLNDDPSSPPLNQRNYLPEVRKEHKICDDKLLVIIAKDLSVEEKTALLTVLKSHKRAIAWKHSDMKKGGFPVVENEDNELIPTRLVTGWRVCIDYHKLNEATLKDHFPLSFMDQMLERLKGNQNYCFLDGFSGYFQIPIDPKNQEKTTFTCPYETFAYRRMPFGLCNAPGTFQSCLSHLEKMLKRCKDTKLCLNWEKSHFMVKEARPMTRLLEKDTPFIFSQECVDAFQTLKKKLTEAPILISPDWDMPFELMCDASDFAIGAVLRQRQDKNFRLIHYASKTMKE